VRRNWYVAGSSTFADLGRRDMSVGESEAESGLNGETVDDGSGGFHGLIFMSPKQKVLILIHSGAERYDDLHRALFTRNRLRWFCAGQCVLAWPFLESELAEQSGE